MADPLQEVMAERARQDAKWGEQNHTDEGWLPILVEELGEVSKAMLEHKYGDGSAEDIRKELVQTAAVSLAWLECIERRG